MSTKRIGLTKSEIERAFDSDALREKFPPIMSTKQAALLLGLSTSTISEWIAKGWLDGAFRRRGKRNLFWRDRVIDSIFNGPNWER